MDAKLYTSKDNKELILSLEDYLKKVTLDGKQKVKTKILFGDITGNIANSKTEFKYADKTYHDYLTLIKSIDGWRIISKTITKIK